MCSFNASFSLYRLDTVTSKIAIKCSTKRKKAIVDLNRIGIAIMQWCGKPLYIVCRYLTYTIRNFDLNLVCIL